MIDPRRRALGKFTVGDDCWLWTDRPDPGGYGRIKMEGRKGRLVQAHRFVYEMLVGPIPEGLQLDHLCRVRNCVRPDHLEPVTGAENQRRGNINQHALKSACPRWHAYKAYPTYEKRTGTTRIWRRCLVCRAEASRRRRAA